MSLFTSDSNSSMRTKKTARQTEIKRLRRTKTKNKDDGRGERGGRERVGRLKVEREGEGHRGT